MIAEAKTEKDFPSIVDVNKECFLAPESMIQEIKEECQRTGQSVPENVGQIMQCVYKSLAVCYKNAVNSLQNLTGKNYTSINIVGGGCQDDYLNQLTAKALGRPVYAGPIEGTAIGNLIVQMCYAEELHSLQEARAVVRESFDIKKVIA